MISQQLRGASYDADVACLTSNLLPQRSWVCCTDSITISSHAAAASVQGSLIQSCMEFGKYVLGGSPSTEYLLLIHYSLSLSSQQHCITLSLSFIAIALNLALLNSLNVCFLPSGEHAV